MENIEIKVKNKVIWLILKYRQWISPAFLPKCRFYPSCSSYAIEVFQENRLIKAFFLVTKRLLKCRPGGASGLDWPPKKKPMR